MSTKKRKKGTGSIKGFIGLLCLIGIALFLHQTNERGEHFSLETAQEKLETAVDGIQQKISGIQQDTKASSSTPAGSSYATHLEIPVTLEKRDEIILKRIGYTLSYNSTYKTPNWVGWELTREETRGKEDRKDRFVPDPDLPEPRVEHADYTRSGYDRGHMAPAADMKWSEEAMAQSFYMSNICPQNQKLNRDDWGDLEEACRGWARKYGRVYIVCGPIYDKKHPKCIGKHQVAVPDRFFKVVLIENRKNPIAMGFLFNNAAHHQALEKYQVPVDSVETVTGLDFFAKLPDSIENRIEAAIPALPDTK